MKVIDKRTKNTSEHYAYGDILKCWNYDPDEYKLYRISNHTESPFDENCYIAALMYDSNGDEGIQWPGHYDSAELLVEDLRKLYHHVEKVNAYIVITD